MENSDMFDFFMLIGVFTIFVLGMFAGAYVLFKHIGK